MKRGKDSIGWLSFLQLQNVGKPNVQYSVLEVRASQYTLNNTDITSIGVQCLLSVKYVVGYATLRLH